MSWLRRPLNLWLRLTERPALARTRTDTIARARRRFERQARLFLRPPRGVDMVWQTLGKTGLRALKIGDAADASGPVLLYFHGGAYALGSPRTVRGMVAHLARAAGAVAYVPRYALAPEAPFPAALEDAVAAYRWCLSEHSDRQLVLGGDSAGGGLALALLAECCRLDLPCPALTFAFSPLTDLTGSGASITVNDRSEVVLPGERLAYVAATYLNGADPRDPRASPLFARFAGAGPVWLTVSRSEILRDDARRMAEALRGQGVPVALIETDGLPHVWPIFAGLLPEADATIAQVAAEIRRVGVKNKGGVA